MRSADSLIACSRLKRIEQSMLPAHRMVHPGLSTIDTRVFLICGGSVFTLCPSASAAVRVATQKPYLARPTLLPPHHFSTNIWTSEPCAPHLPPPKYRFYCLQPASSEWSKPTSARGPVAW